MTVDAVTGDSTITSTHSAVRVRSTSERFDQETILNPTEQITVRRGAPPPAHPEQLGPRQITELTTCIADLREAALQQKRGDLVDDTITRMAESEISRGRSLGRAPTQPTPQPENQTPGGDLNDLGNVCTPVDCGDYQQPRGPAAVVN